MGTGLQLKSSFLFATMLSILVTCVLQIQRHWFTSSQLHTILGGYIGSILFTLMLTAVGNLQSILFGDRFQTKLFPEVVSCMGMAIMFAALVHRVCATSCLIFSLVSLYYINKASKSAVEASAPTVNNQPKKKTRQS